jgi:hypothetical protein
VNAEIGHVKCTSGYTYAQRPVSFTFEGQEIQVKEIVAEWREPAAKKFVVLSEHGQQFELGYQIEEQQWQILLLPGDHLGSQGDKNNN